MTLRPGEMAATGAVVIAGTTAIAASRTEVEANKEPATETTAVSVKLQMIAGIKDSFGAILKTM